MVEKVVVVVVVELIGGVVLVVIQRAGMVELKWLIVKV